jgi:hypothetical protein
MRRRTSRGASLANDVTPEPVPGGGGAARRSAAAGADLTHPARAALGTGCAEFVHAPVAVVIHLVTADLERGDLVEAARVRVDLVVAVVAVILQRGDARIVSPIPASPLERAQCPSPSSSHAQTHLLQPCPKPMQTPGAPLPCVQAPPMVSQPAEHTPQEPLWHDSKPAVHSASELQALQPSSKWPSQSLSLSSSQISAALGETVGSLSLQSVGAHALSPSPSHSCTQRVQPLPNATHLPPDPPPASPAGIVQAVPGLQSWAQPMQVPSTHASPSLEHASSSVQVAQPSSMKSLQSSSMPFPQTSGAPTWTSRLSSSQSRCSSVGQWPSPSLSHSRTQALQSLPNAKQVVPGSVHKVPLPQALTHCWQTPATQFSSEPQSAALVHVLHPSSA